MMTPQEIYGWIVVLEDDLLLATGWREKDGRWYAPEGIGCVTGPEWPFSRRYAVKIMRDKFEDEVPRHQGA